MYFLFFSRCCFRFCSSKSKWNEWIFNRSWISLAKTAYFYKSDKNGICGWLDENGFSSSSFCFHKRLQWNHVRWSKIVNWSKQMLIFELWYNQCPNDIVGRLMAIGPNGQRVSGMCMFVCVRCVQQWNMEHMFYLKASQSHKSMLRSILWMDLKR